MLEVPRKLTHNLTLGAPHLPGFGQGGAISILVPETGNAKLETESQRADRRVTHPPLAVASEPGDASGRLTGGTLATCPFMST